MDLGQLLGLDEIKIAFLVSGAITLIFLLLAVRVRSPQSVLGEIFQVIVHVLLVPFALLFGLTFFILFTGTDPVALRLQFSRFVSGARNVSFLDAIPPHLQDTLNVTAVNRIDTDGDEFEEWLVFYQYDLQGNSSPVLGVVYDNDRGNPPVIFPYQLRVPGRDPLSTFYRAVNFDLMDVTQDNNGLGGANLPELRVFDGSHLAFFRFNQNSAEWDFPRDAPPRYEAIGYFVGSGGVRFNETTKDVTTIDRETYSRSQLALRSVYELNSVSNSYWDDFDEGILAAPRISTVDFFASPPQNILNTEYPEKIVLGFYASTCSAQDQTLCRHATAGWDPESFLVPNGDAWREVENNNAGYFGLNSLNGTQRLIVSDIRYYPEIETASSADTVTGPQPQRNVVDIVFSINGAPSQGYRYLMEFDNGKWKISRRISADEILPSITDPPAIEVGSAQ